MTAQNRRGEQLALGNKALAEVSGLFQSRAGDNECGLLFLEARIVGSDALCVPIL